MDSDEGHVVSKTDTSLAAQLDSLRSLLINFGTMKQQLRLRGGRKDEQTTLKESEVRGSNEEYAIEVEVIDEDKEGQRRPSRRSDADDARTN